MKAIVLAGGQSSGLGSLTLDTPTAALPIAGKPLIARMLDYLELHGVGGAIVSCYRWPDLVERAIEPYSGRLPVTTVLERAPFGSANLIVQLASHLEQRFVVVMGNVLTDLDLRAAIEEHIRWGALATVLVVESDDPSLSGEVAVDRNGAIMMIGCEQLVRRHGKRLANSGIYILEPQVLELVPQDCSFDLAGDLLSCLVEKEMPVYASRQEGCWFLLGSHEAYRASSLALLQGKIRGMRPEGWEVSPGVWLAEGARVDPRATLNPPLLIDKGCRVERDAIIGPNAILGDGVHVKRGGAVRGTVVLSGSKVGLATKLEDSVVRGNVVARGPSSDVICVDDRQMLDTLKPSDSHPLLRSIIDRILALGALLLASPLMLFIALLVRLDSPGPALYSQLRVGQGRRTSNGQYQGKVFELLKFRTMYEDADQRLKEMLEQNEYGSAAFVKIKDDPRITRVGKLLRATSLDELPQFLNVVKGDMGLVGNRPLPLYEAEQLDDDWQRIRFNAPTGITGLWQISGRSDLSAEERIVLDNYYALTHSLWSDIKILLVTIPALLAKRGAR
ncbi:MAG: hypothetical protein EPO21_04835 [Chloroflexota bacterium]|nr:MAG: hypothetical protein EPO21_04835 [Chloroflexota bacterium]